MNISLIVIGWGGVGSLSLLASGMNCLIYIDCLTVQFQMLVIGHILSHSSLCKINNKRGCNGQLGCIHWWEDCWKSCGSTGAKPGDDPFGIRADWLSGLLLSLPLTNIKSNTYLNGTLDGASPDIFKQMVGCE